MKRTNILKLLTLALAALLLVGVLAGCGGSSSTGSDSAASSGSDATYRTVEEIQESGKVVIGVFSDKAPFGYVDENGEYQGYDVYFAERIAQDLGVEVEYVSTDPASRVENVATGKVDIILANFTVTEERAQQVDFALPYMQVMLGVVSPDSDIVTDVEDLNGKTLIVVKGTTAETYFEENYPDVELLKYDEYADAYNALLDGRGDAFSTDNTEVLAWALTNPGFTVGIDALGNADTIAPAVQKGNTSLLNWINDEIVALADEEFFHADYAETLAPVYGEAANPDSLVIEGGVLPGADTAAAAADTVVTEPEAKALDKDAYDALIASGIVADDDVIAASEWASAVKEAGVLRVGGTRTSFLFSQLDETDDSLRGFDAGLYQLLARYILGDESAYDLTQVDSSTRESVLTSGQVDAVFATYSITPARQEVISFAGPYYTSQQAILVKAGNTEIADLDDLAGKTVATQAGSTGPDILAEYAPDAIVQEFQDNTTATQALAQGRVDAYVTDYTLHLNTIVKNPGEYEIAGGVFGPEDNYGIGLPLDSDGVAFVNAFLQELVDNGTWAQLWQITLGDRTGISSAPEAPVIG